jgi:hypothetical protein
MTTNCGSGGATARTAYAKELMRHIDVHSYGQCLHNKDFPPGKKQSIIIIFTLDRDEISYL